MKENTLLKANGIQTKIKAKKQIIDKLAEKLPNSEKPKYRIAVSLVASDGRTEEWFDKIVSPEIVSKVQELIVADINDQKRKLEKEFNEL